MTPEEIGRLTIAEVEAITERATNALRAFQEAQRMLGGTPQHQRPPAEVHPHTQAMAVMDQRSTEQRAYLESMRGSAERQRLLEQFNQPEEQ